MFNLAPSFKKFKFSSLLSFTFVQNRKRSHLVRLLKTYFIINLVNPSSFRTLFSCFVINYFKNTSCCYKKEVITKNKKNTLQERQSVLFFFKA